MRAFKTNSRFELSVQKVEQLMREEGLIITSAGGMGILISSEKLRKAAWIQNGSERTYDFPRFTDEERLVLAE